MLIEVYNEAGDLILDNESKVLKVFKELTLTTPYKIKSGIYGPVGDWVADWQIAGYLANGGGYTEFVASPHYMSATNTYDPAFAQAELAWLRPYDGTSILTSAVLWGVSALDGYWNVRGGGYSMKFTKQLIPADASGYIDCYNEAGELTWSLNALLTTPQVMGVFNGNTVRSINLNNYPDYMREKLYFTTTNTGRYVVGEDFAEYFAVQVQRVGNMVYFGGIEGNVVDAFILMAYIP